MNTDNNLNHFMNKKGCFDHWMKRLDTPTWYK